MSIQELFLRDPSCPLWSTLLYGDASGWLESHNQQGFRTGDRLPDQSNAQNYESACPWDIYSHPLADEIVDWLTKWLSTT
jgi:hypothetical protein